MARLVLAVFVLAVLAIASISPAKTNAGPGPRPDVVIASLSIGSGTVASGATAPLQLVVTNRGTGTAYAVDVTISMVTGGTASQVSRISLGTLKAGASGTAVTTFTAPTQAGTYKLVGKATASHDADKGNNWITATLQVADSPPPPPAPGPPPPPAPGPPSPSTTCDYYAAPNGVGDGRTSSSPFMIASFWPLATSGKTLCLLNGTYQGTGNMLVPPSGLSGTSGQPISVRAVNDGGVLIDGQRVRRACYLNGNNYWSLQGFNCAYANDIVFVIRNSSHVTAQRIVAWDTTTDANSQVAMLWDSNNTLLEDVAFFGYGVAPFVEYGSGTRDNVIRRMWMRGEGYNQPGNPAVANQFNYTSANHPGPSLVENVIAIIGSLRGELQYGTNWVRNNALSPYQRFYGTIHYYQGTGSCCAGNGITNSGGYTGVIVQDALVSANGLNEAPYVLGNNAWESPKQPSTATRLTSVRGTKPSVLGSEWTVANAVEATTISGTGFNYQGNNNTAKLCNQYVNGTLTSTPLWPWPMDSRIKAAIAINAGNGSPILAGSAGTFYAANTVTSEIVNLFGAIPAACHS